MNICLVRLLVALSAAVGAWNMVPRGRHGSVGSAVDLVLTTTTISAHHTHQSSLSGVSIRFKVSQHTCRRLYEDRDGSIGTMLTSSSTNNELRAVSLLG